ncbi:MAG: indole-3-glycerol phosphate synthase TrpC [Gemmatimonadota bacterium]|nr:indole-3-glycerol phosphate synthase TrpC [Gemmatimonadota bacterium]
MSDISFPRLLEKDTQVTEHLPNSYVSRRLTEAQASSHWSPPGGTLGDLVAAAKVRAQTLGPRTAELFRAAQSVSQTPSLRSALSARSVGIIAEVKRASPSRGVINGNLNAAGQAREYERGGAVAVSVLTEPSRFGGSIDDVVAVNAAVAIPVLKKDFHVDRVQLLEARAIGSSAALVIVRSVAPSTLAELLLVGGDIGLEILVEVRDQHELELALSSGAELIGVNNRNLETLEVDRSTIDRIVPMIPRSCCAVAESGFETRGDVELAAASGADAVLVGSVLSVSAEPEAAVRSLTAVPRRSDARKN